MTQDLADGESCEMKGSGAKPYVLKNTGGVYSCSCPAWRNQSVAIERRTCKHLRKLRGDDAETARVGSLPARPAARSKSGKEGPPLLLAHAWDNSSDLAGWWMSEKLDGVRAYWTGEAFLSRLGNTYHAPDWFTEGLPAHALDGELWIARGAFQRTVSVVRRQDKSEHWRDVRFVVFDAPALEQPFEARIEALLSPDCLGSAPYADALAHEVCEGEAHLRSRLSAVEAEGGEGLMLRAPGSRYEVGRSTTLLKVKSFQDDEAVVVRHTPGRGKHKGTVGSLVVRRPDGTEFSVGTGLSDAQRREPPPVGTTITFRFQELTEGGVPRFPSFVGVREDVAPMVLEAPAESVDAPPSSGDSERLEGARRFEFSDGKSEKFWEVAVDGTDVTVRYGRIGTKGQTKTKSFAAEDKALAHRDREVEKKVAKGYGAVD